MKVDKFIQMLNSEFYVGVPDSKLRALCDFIMDRHGISDRHIVAANEGNAVAIAAGYHIATGKVPVIYMQNSGIGNAINPIISLISKRVYKIPCIFVIGWRGEPGIHDEPQHIFQGEITEQLLSICGLQVEVIDENTSPAELGSIMDEYRKRSDLGDSIAFLVKKGGLEYDNNIEYKNSYTLIRERALEIIADMTEKDIIVSTTGKTSRELYEIRERNNIGHQYDFLTVGSMGHSSSIALGMALQKKQKRIWCIDGDGAAIMHMGAMATIGQIHPDNLVHIIINNESHESVGGMPTAGGVCEFSKVAEACGYRCIHSVDTEEKLVRTMRDVIDRRELSFIEVKCDIGSRGDLGRPHGEPHVTKELLMRNI